MIAAHLVPEHVGSYVLQAMPYERIEAAEYIIRASSSLDVHHIQDIVEHFVGIYTVDDPSYIAVETVKNHRREVIRKYVADYVASFKPGAVLNYRRNYLVVPYAKHYMSDSQYYSMRLDYCSEVGDWRLFIIKM